MIKIKELYKTYKTKKHEVPALKNINLSIKRGDIFGVIGFSGAGKSTLVRCLNRLEEPDSGYIEIDGVPITELNDKGLQEARKKIGMVFQQFNLFDSKTVYGNVAFPLVAAKKSESFIRHRVEEVLGFVGLADKSGSYPAQLSGGQKQRVGIARALINDPDVLLCDEATSALDPQTTYSILELLKEINERLDLTIVIITHELDVLQHACRNMAVMEDGEIVETGPVEKLLLQPESNTSRQFVKILEHYDRRRQEVEGGLGI